ncbi:hypothetical protein [Caulifigura coniformis]|uniref:hypothetical protein n=1 Tax=Caulifigura coniformis TaxID=2527983 RepID=UPI00119E4B70|nr:hypothetical protein [Caulifigura coniformis]
MLAENPADAGFHFKPPEHAEIVEKCTGRAFLNFDDAAYSPDMRRFLAERFPEISLYEMAGTAAPARD